MYKMITGDSNTFVDGLNKAVTDGWIPIGHPIVVKMTAYGDVMVVELGILVRKNA